VVTSILIAPFIPIKKVLIEHNLEVLIFIRRKTYLEKTLMIDATIIHKDSMYLVIKKDGGGDE
jgi:hypothetical protein